MLLLLALLLLLQARLQLQQSGLWVAAAFAARAVAVTEQQIEVSRHLARSAARPIANREDFESFCARAANSNAATVTAAAAAAAAAHGISGAMLRRMHAAAAAAEASAVSLQDGFCKEQT